MTENNQEKSKMFNSGEEAVSMVLGLVIVVVIVGLIFNFFQKRKGSVSIPGITTSQKVGNVEVTGGEKLTNKTEAVATSGGEYTVNTGDNLWKIATKQMGSGYEWTKIAKLNNMSDPGLLTVGQKLKIPLVSDKTVVVTKETVTKEVSESVYKTVKGDSLWKISVKNYGNGYAWVNIWKANKKLIRDPNKLFVGTKLILPKLVG